MSVRFGSGLRAVACVALTGLTAAPALATEHSFEAYFGWVLTGVNYTIDPGHLVTLGEFSGTSTSSGADVPKGLETIAWQCPGTFDVDFPNNKVTGSGYCTATAISGDAFYFKWNCTGGLDGATGKGALPFGKGNSCNGGGTITGGTGALKGLKGKDELMGFTLLVHPDGKASGYTLNKWTVELP
jgi:hypothetical protein